MYGSRLFQIIRLSKWFLVYCAFRILRHYHTIFFTLRVILLQGKKLQIRQSFFFSLLIYSRNLSYIHNSYILFFPPNVLDDRLRLNCSDDDGNVDDDDNVYILRIAMIDLWILLGNVNISEPRPTPPFNFSISLNHPRSMYNSHVSAI